MLRTTNSAERTVQAQSPNVITLGAAATTAIEGKTYKGQEVLSNRRNLGMIEIANCYIQNTGTNRVYFAINTLGCNDTDYYHGYLEAGQQLDCSNHRSKVWMYSPSGSTVAVLQFNRNDLTGEVNNGVIRA